MNRLGSGLLLLLAAPLMASAQISAANTACTQHYVVKDGDTCDSIGQKTLTSTYQIMALNLPEAGPNCYSLNIGVQLCLGNYGNDCQFVHRVIGTDTCDTLTAEYSISRDTLLNNNPNINCDSLYDGLMLCVSQGSIRPPAPPNLKAVFPPGAAPVNTNATTMPLGVAIVPEHTLLKPNLPVPAPAPAPADTKQNIVSSSKHHVHRPVGGGHQHHRGH